MRALTNESIHKAALDRIGAAGRKIIRDISEPHQPVMELAWTITPILAGPTEQRTSTPFFGALKVAKIRPLAEDLDRCWYTQSP